MVREGDNIGASRAMDLLDQCTELVQKISSLLLEKNRKVAGDDYGRMENIERIENRLIQRLEEKYQQYVKTLEQYGDESFAPMNMVQSIGADPGRNIRKNGFHLLNEASGLKLKIKLDNYRRNLTELQKMQETNMQMYLDRLNFYNITLNSLCGEEKSETYGPKDESHGSGKRGRSVLLNKVV